MLKPCLNQLPHNIVGYRGLGDAWDLWRGTSCLWLVPNGGTSVVLVLCGWVAALLGGFQRGTSRMILLYPPPICIQSI